MLAVGFVDIEQQTKSQYTGAFYNPFYDHKLHLCKTTSALLLKLISITMENQILPTQAQDIIV